MSDSKGTSQSNLDLSAQATPRTGIAQRGATQLAEFDTIITTSSRAPAAPRESKTQNGETASFLFSLSNFAASLADSLVLISILNVAILAGPPASYAVSSAIALPVVSTCLCLCLFIRWKHAQAWLHASLALRALGCAVLPFAYVMLSSSSLESLETTAITTLCIFASIHCLSSSLTMRQWGIPLRSRKNDLILFGQIMALPTACLIKQNLVLDSSFTIKLCIILYILALWAILEGTKRVETQTALDGRRLTLQLSEISFTTASKFAKASLLAASTLSIASVCTIIVPIALFSTTATSIGKTTTFLDLFWYLSSSFVIGCCIANHLVFAARQKISHPFTLAVAGLVIMGLGLFVLGTLGLGEWCRAALFVIGIGGGISIYSAEMLLAFAPLASNILAPAFAMRAAIVLSISLSMSAMAESSLPSTSPTFVFKALAMFAFALTSCALPAMLLALKQLLPSKP